MSDSRANYKDEPGFDAQDTDLLAEVEDEQQEREGQSMADWWASAEFWAAVEEQERGMAA